MQKTARMPRDLQTAPVERFFELASPHLCAAGCTRDAT